MFDSNNKKPSITQPTSQIPKGLEGIEVHSIPSAFYDGGMGEGVAHHAENKAPQTPLQQPPKPPIASTTPKPVAQAPLPTPPGIKPPPQTATPASIHHGSGLIVGLIIIILVALVGAGGAYYLYVYRPAHTAPPIVETPPQPIEQTLPVEETTSTPPTEIATSTPEVAPIPTAPKEFPVGLRDFNLALDTDGDALTDHEEQTIYHSDPQKPDTDGDGYLDGHEVLNLYNPSGFEPQKLLAAGLVREYKNTVFGYSMFYPKTWQVGPVDQDGKDVLFTGDSGEFVEVNVHPNLEKKSLVDWYLNRAPKVTAEKLTNVSVKSGLQALVSPDQLSVFFTRDTVVYEVRYDIGVRIDAQFMRTFEMMQESFSYTTAPAYVPKEAEITPVIPPEPAALPPEPTPATTSTKETAPQPGI